MADKQFPEPGFEPTDERTALEAWLDYHRGVLVWKLDGLGDDDAKRAIVPSGTSLAGLVKHLADVEDWWFRQVFVGDVDAAPDDRDRDANFKAGPDEAVADLIAVYRETCERSRRIVAQAGSLDDLARHPDATKPTLRWIMNHMIEETARHNGHADILRELIDGTVGD
ncbi:MAG: hypothetical protein QOK43_1739 [Acidimicrobiaceae bacterium]|nr:hypothetical protein [Acidimicrobiaceae bacterium]